MADQPPTPRDYAREIAVLGSRRSWALTIGALLVAYTLPLWGNAYLVGTANRLAYTIIALQGLNILTGLAGQISLGQAAFMLVGGYASALAMIHWHLPIFLTVPLAGLAAGLVGLLFGLPSLRVKGFYLAMATLAAQFIIPWLSRNLWPELLGGTEGRIAVPVPTLAGVRFDSSESFLYLTLTTLVVTTLLTLNVSRTRLGRAFISIRDNEIAAELLGIRLFGYKLRAFFIAATLAGVAGALKAHSQRGVGTEFGYDLTDSILFLGMLIVGGLGSNLGPYLGAATVILLEDLAIEMGGLLAELFPAQSANLLTSFRPIFFGLVLILFLIFEPNGLAHRWRWIRARWRQRRASG